MIKCESIDKLWYNYKCLVQLDNLQKVCSVHNCLFNKNGDIRQVNNYIVRSKRHVIVVTNTVTGRTSKTLSIVMH